MSAGRSCYSPCVHSPRCGSSGKDNLSCRFETPRAALAMGPVSGLILPMLTAWWQQGVARVRHLFKRSGAHTITLYTFPPGFAFPQITPFAPHPQVHLHMPALTYLHE